jgi:hypothetical protein
MFRSFVKWSVVAVLMCSLPVGCNLFVDSDGDGETNTSELKAFGSEAELVAYMRGQITQRNSSFSGVPRDEDTPTAPGQGTDGSAEDGDGPGPSPAPGDPNLSAGGDGEGHSGTTTQEEGVDESDVVKTDGRNLYVISSHNSNSVLRIVGLGTGGETQLLSETELEGYGRDLYLHGSQVVVLTSGGGYAYPILFDGVAVGAAGAAEITEGESNDDVINLEPISVDIGIVPPGEFVYERPSTRTTVVDVSNPAAPRVLSSTKIDGSTASSRMVNGVMHLVLANYQEYYYDVLPRLGAPELDVSDVDAELILPKYTRTNADGTEESGNVVTWENLYRPTDPDGFGVVTVVDMDIDADARFTAAGVVAEPGLIYSSTEALYLTDTNYDWQGRSRTTTDVYKFKYDGRGAIPVAFGSVPGRILNQYSMSEHNGNLRVATTFDASWSFDEETGIGGQVTESSNNVYVLAQADAALNVVGRIENIAPGETIQSARFLGDRGYVVTFLQIDPLFTVDLADPANPRLMGQLKVPGFSTFLTPIDANHMLAVGQYIPPPETPGNWGVQLSIFDVTDFANPALKSNVILGADANTSAYSEALWDPKALTYFAEGGVIALPMSIYDYSYFGGGEGGGGVIVDGEVKPTEPGSGDSGSGSTGSGGGSDGADAVPPDDGTITDPPIDVIPEKPQGFEGVYVFRVSAETGLTELGRVSTRFDDVQFWGASFTRGVFVGDDLFAVTDLGVHSASLDDLATVKSELFFGLPYDVENPVPTEPAPLPGVEEPVADPDTPVSDDGTGVTVIDPAPPVLGSEIQP